MICENLVRMLARLPPAHIVLVIRQYHRFVSSAPLRFSLQCSCLQAQFSIPKAVEVNGALAANECGSCKDRLRKSPLDFLNRTNNQSHSREFIVVPPSHGLVSDGYTTVHVICTTPLPLRMSSVITFVIAIAEVNSPLPCPPTCLQA